MACAHHRVNPDCRVRRCVLLVLLVTACAPGAPKTDPIDVPPPDAGPDDAAPDGAPARDAQGTSTALCSQTCEVAGPDPCDWTCTGQQVCGTTCGECIPAPEACSCSMRAHPDNRYPPCSTACTHTLWRWSFWVTNYNVAGTLGVGEHQGIGLIGYRYSFDPRFAPPHGLPPPWLEETGDYWRLDDASSAEVQFRKRTINPGGEVYAKARRRSGDSSDNYFAETMPEEPHQVPHAALEHAALCTVEPIRDERYFNHGRTLAETVPNHHWDSFFTRRKLIPLRLLTAIVVEGSPSGRITLPSAVTEDEVTAEDVGRCLDVLADGFCDSVCGNCSYVMPAGFTGLSFEPDQPGYQIAGLPQQSTGPYQIDGFGDRVFARENWAADEDGRQVWYVGGGRFGRPEDVADFQRFSDWPDPDGVPAQPETSWITVSGKGAAGEDDVPTEWQDPFTHCFDPLARRSSQRPAGLPQFISGRWGHNSNTDAKAQYRQFVACSQNPRQAQDLEWTNENICSLCGTPRTRTLAADDEEPRVEPVQYPCRDYTHTAEVNWDKTFGMHNIDDLDLGRFSSVHAPRQPTAIYAEVPAPICRTSGRPVYGK